MSTSSPVREFWSHEQTLNYSISTMVASGLTFFSTLVSFYLIFRDRKWTSSLTSRALITVFIGDFIYASTSLLGAVGYFAPPTNFDVDNAGVCVAWGSFIYFGHNLVFFSLINFFICSLTDSSTGAWTNTVRKYFILLACLPVALAALFQVIWAVTYQHRALDLAISCGATNCVEVIHADSSHITGLRFLYILPLLLTMLVCPVLAYLAVRSARNLAKNSGSFTEKDHKKISNLISLNIFYLATLCLCFWPNLAEFFYAFTLGECNHTVDSVLYIFYFCQALFNPLHGLWNAFIFVWRPRIQAHKESVYRPLKDSWTAEK